MNHNPRNVSGPREEHKCRDAARHSADERLVRRGDARGFRLRLAVLLALVVFVLAMFQILAGIFLFVGLVLYSISIMYWLYPDERLFPSHGTGEPADTADDAEGRGD